LILFYFFKKGVDMKYFWIFWADNILIFDVFEFLVRLKMTVFPEFFIVNKLINRGFNDKNSTYSKIFKFSFPSFV